MRKLHIKFPDQIRISGWGFDSSARAMNQKGGIATQAELVKVISSTTERKKMSSTIKRVALVAVAALGLGTLTTVAANAAVVADALTTSGSASTATSSGVVGSASTVNLIWTGISSAAGVDVTTVSNTLLSSPITNSNTAVTYTDTADATQVNSAITLATGVVAVPAVVDGGAVGRVTRYITASYTPTVVGTYSIKFSYSGGANSATSYVVWTINVAAKAVANSTATTAVSTSVVGSGNDTDGIFAPKGTNVVKVATILVTAANGDTDHPLLNADALAKTATISGPGLISWVDATKARAVSSAAGTLAQTLSVWSDGTSGVATITITDGGFTKTKKITFYGTATKLAVTTVSNVVSDAAIATDFATVAAVDAAGVAVPLSAGSVTTTNGAFTVSFAAGVATLSLDPAASTFGSKATTFTDTDSALTIDASVLVSSATAATLAVEVPADALVPGVKYSIKITAKDANGYAVPDGDRFFDVTTSRASSVVAPTHATFTNGVATVDLYAPVTPGDFTVTVADHTVTTVLNTQTVAMGNASQDAIDAANEATDAANAATDAANAAAEAADAATAAAQDAQSAAQDAQTAVTELATQVAALIAGIKAQITTLTNLIVKIQKKVKA